MELYSQEDTIKISGIPINSPYYYVNKDCEADGYIPHVIKAVMEDVGHPYNITSVSNDYMYHNHSIEETDNILRDYGLYR